MPAKNRTPRDRKIIVSIATSADGYIARKNGSVDWLDRPRPKGFYGMLKFLRTIDTILWGRKTFAPVLRKGSRGVGFGPKVKSYVFTHHPPKQQLPGVEFITEAPAKFARRLRAAAGKNIWIMGGGELIASFLDARAIDEFVISVIPTFIGEGIPLIAPRRRTVQLELLSSRKFEDGVVQLHYRVKRQ